MPIFNDGEPGSAFPGAEYITVAEFVSATDRRTIAQLGSDTGTPLTWSDPVSDDDDAQGIIGNAIQRASAEVALYARRGGRYSAERLEALAFANDWSLKGLVVVLAQRNLHLRRSGEMPPAVAEAVKRAEDLLRELGEGITIFGDAGAESAGKADVVVLSAAKRGRLRLVSDEPYFRPRRTYEI